METSVNKQNKLKTNYCSVMIKNSQNHHRTGKLVIKINSVIFLLCLALRCTNN